MSVTLTTNLTDYFTSLTDDTGCVDYLFSPTPLELEKKQFNELNTLVTKIIDLIDTPEYYAHCREQNNWSLPTPPMRKEDYTGCADFLLTQHGAKLIEVNMNIPGKIGLMQQLGEASRDYLDMPFQNWTNLDFNDLFIQTVRQALPNSKNIAIVVSHLPSSRKHYPHYNHFSEQLNKCGLHVSVVPANELHVTDNGFKYKNEFFDGIINLVIPFVWENNPEEFEQLTQLLKTIPENIFPNPTGGMLGTKDLLNFLSEKKHSSKIPELSDTILSAFPLKHFTSVRELTDQFSLNEIVLKPLKDYDSKGVFVQPSLAEIKEVFERKQSTYMFQEFTDSLEIPFQITADAFTKSHSVIYRIYFAAKSTIGCQAYYVHNSVSDRYVTAPVLYR